MHGYLNKLIGFPIIHHFLFISVNVDGGWGSWSEWNICSTQCGTGVRTRLRFCNSPPRQNDGAACVGPQTLHEICEATNCDGGIFCLFFESIKFTIPVLLIYLVCRSLFFLIITNKHLFVL